MPLDRARGHARRAHAPARRLAASRRARRSLPYGLTHERADCDARAVTARHPSTTTARAETDDGTEKRSSLALAAAFHPGYPSPLQRGGAAGLGSTGQSRADRERIAAQPDKPAAIQAERRVCALLAIAG